MGIKKPQTARQLAFDVLCRFDIQHHNAAELLHKVLHKTSEKRLATDLVYGVLRNRAVLDMTIAGIGVLEVVRIPEKILTILRIAGYELIFCPETAEYAIVNEAVNLAGQVAGKKQTGFVNAVLRKMVRSAVKRKVLVSAENERRTIPVSGGYGCEFKMDLFAEPGRNQGEYLSRAFSLPQWLVEGWLGEFGLDSTKEICLASNRRAAVFLRPNSLKISVQELAETFRDEKIEFDVLGTDEMLKIKSHQAVFNLPGFDEGLFTVQDPSASKAVKALSPKPGWVIGDICSAPGGKTTQLAELMKNKGKIIATDIDQGRLGKVTQNCKRLGVTIVEIVPYSDFFDSAGQIPAFDAILLDVPCSNTGVLARRCEVRLRIKPGAIAELSKIQTQLLQQSAGLLKTSGKLCYSTCSLQKTENSEVVDAFLSKNSDFKLEYQELILPSAEPFGCDGGYVAILVKK